MRAIYSEEILVGFLVFCLNPDMDDNYWDDNYWIPAIMIDDKHQGKGYGKAAMEP
ncbi:GNAT family N-acetyltransferase [Paenibacillus sp. FSL W8-0186]|uniref:GNAT family N-acetyltransferase n=1 Tax=Paenibacillus sp. FSL W8-0186 TaxID=2921709 RepID=UPI0030D01691